MEQLDLLNLDRALTPEERRKLYSLTRTKKRGHAAPIGTGPAGETCKTCNFLRHNRMAKTYLKCGHVNAPKWTGGYGTDVRARDAACKYWEKNNG